MTSKFLSALSTLALFGTLITFNLPVKAQESEEETPLVQVALTPDKVKNFIAAFKDVKTWQKAQHPDKASGDAEQHDDTEETDAMSVPQNPESTEKMKVIVKKYGFDTLETWEQTAQTVMLAYGYADPESGMADLKKNLTDSIEQIKKDATLPASEKEEAIKNLNEEIASSEKMKPLPANVEAVKPFVSEIKKTVESE